MVGVANGQEDTCSNANIDAMRGRANIGASDQRRISDWVQGQIDGFKDWASFRDCFAKQVSDSGNSPQFTVQLVTQTAEIAATQFASPAIAADAAHALARVLVDMNRPETYVGLMAGLKLAEAPARFVCVLGLLRQQSSVAADQAKLTQTVQSLRDVGLTEKSPVVLGRIYEVLAIPGQVGAVFDAYTALFDKRLEDRRKLGFVEDGAELYAFEFFRSSAVQEALSTAQKSQLVSRVAVFLRFAAERYDVPGLGFAELDMVERVLDGAEDVLEGVVGGNQGGKIRDALSAGGAGKSRAILQEAYRWVGNATDGTKGVLNAAPWNVPAGAP
jgi:hypothetical protein